jgi:hypothetical protein
VKKCPPKVAHPIFVKNITFVHMFISFTVKESNPTIWATSLNSKKCPNLTFAQ